MNKNRLVPIGRATTGAGFGIFIYRLAAKTIIDVRNGEDDDTDV